MSTPQEILQEMIDAAPATSEAIETSITQIQVQIDTFQEKQDAMKTGVGDEAASRLESYLIGTKYTPVGNYYQYKGTTYNAIETAGGTITDWKIYKILSSLEDVEFVDDVTFMVKGDQTAILTEGADLSFLGDSRTYGEISTSEYKEISDPPPEPPDPEEGKTKVVLVDSALDSSLISIWKLEYIYASGDTTVDEIKTQWDFAHDYIVTPLGLATGTYGTQDNIAKLTDAKNMLATNKAKIDNSVAVFNEFV